MQEEERRTRQSIEADQINKKTSCWLQIHKRNKISNRKIAEQCSIKHHISKAGWLRDALLAKRSKKKVVIISMETPYGDNKI